MSRLTNEEIKKCYDYHSQGRTCGKTLLFRTCNELLEYKAIEQELGIDLITLFKALTKGVYVKSSKGKIEFIEQVAMDNIRENPCVYYCNKKTIDLGGLIRPFYTDLYFKDYGKSWALSREELK